jgi:hypothetical protein
VRADNDPGSGDGTSGLWTFNPDGVSQATHYPYSDGNIYESFGTTARKTVGNPTPSLAAWRLYNISSASGAYTVRLDGTQIFTTGTNTVGFPTAPQLGRSWTTTFTTYFPGDYAELIVCSVLSGGDRTSMNAYIASEYSLTIA